MQIGVVYPQNELRGDPSAVRRIGKAVEDPGFAQLLAYDQVLGAVHADRTPQLPGPHTEHDPFHDPYVMFAHLAGITEAARFADGFIFFGGKSDSAVDDWKRLCDRVGGLAGRSKISARIGWCSVGAV